MTEELGEPGLRLSKVYFFLSLLLENLDATKIMIGFLFDFFFYVIIVLFL